MSRAAATRDGGAPALRGRTRGLGTLLRRSRAARLGLVGAVLLAGLVTVAVAAPLLAPHDPQATVAAPYSPPGPGLLLGSNDVGQDVLSELIYGARVSLLVGVLAGVVAVALGTLAALAAGWSGGVVDAGLMRLVDLTLALPFLPLLIVLAAFLGRSLAITIGVIALVLWARPARVLRAQVLATRSRGDVQAARSMGAGSSHLLRRHVLPALSPLMIAQFVRSATIAILIEASLSFLGLGDPTAKSWGTMLFYANSRGAFLTDAWRWWVLPTGLAISLLVLSFAFLGYALEEWADPRLRTRTLPTLAQFETQRRDSEEAVTAGVAR